MIIDTHAHFYDPSRPQGVPWPRPEDKSLYRTILPEQLKVVAVPEGVTGTVVVEASPWVEDNQWVLDIAAREPFVVGFVGNLDPASAEFAKNLDRFSADPLFRGIRVGGGAVKQPLSSTVLDSLKRLQDKDLELDILLGPPALADAAALAEALPRLRIVLNHVGAVRIDGNAPDPVWVTGMKQAAAYPHVYCKVSSLSSFVKMPQAPAQVSFYAPTLDVLWNAFGEDRLFYGSDWPVSARNSDYATMMQVVRKYFGAKGPAAAAKFFWRNSQAAYRWVPRTA